jgi:hypothetical protein
VVRSVSWGDNNKVSFDYRRKSTTHPIFCPQYGLKEYESDIGIINEVPAPIAISVGWNTTDSDVVNTLRLDFDQRITVVRNINAVVHCIEAMPIAAASLLKTSLQLAWQVHSSQT